MVKRILLPAILVGGLVSAALTATPSVALAANGSPGGDATAAIVAWNAETLSVTAAAPVNPPREGRSVAIESAAVYDAVNSITSQFAPYSVRLKVSRPSSVAAAADEAAYATMSSLYPDQQAKLDAFEATQLAAIPDGPAKANGL